jgi:hypothetical protein
MFEKDLSIAQYNRGAKKNAVQKKGCQRGKKKDHQLTPPRGAARQNEKCQQIRYNESFQTKQNKGC